MYKRTYGSVVYLVDEEGKLVTDDTVYVEVSASGSRIVCVLSLCSNNPDLSDIIAAWGKTPAVFSSQDPGAPDYTITIGDDFVNIVEETATPAIEELPAVTILCTPALPANINSSGSLQIRKSDGSNWTEAEIESIKINGVSPTSGNSVEWSIEGGSLTYRRGSATDVATLTTVAGGEGIAVTSVEFS